MNSLNGGYAMIKYNSTQEELQIAYRSKKPVLCYDENRRAHWAVIEETATESVDEETQEPITIYEYSYRLIDEATLDDIVDSHGNKRFVEGNLTFETAEGITYTYGKWSLSGTHLMLVLAISIDKGVKYANGDELASVNLPSWITNKIYPTALGIIEYKTNLAIGQDYTNQDFSTYLWKTGSLIKISKSGPLTLTAKRNVRIQFDLLIDAE